MLLVVCGLVSIRNYIALKPKPLYLMLSNSLVSIRNYIALKLIIYLFICYIGLVSIRNYIALKLVIFASNTGQFSIHTKLHRSKTW